MQKKKTITIIIGILLVLTLFTGVSAFSYDEDEEGNPFLESEFDVKSPSITIKNLFILQPNLEPANPEFGTIYLDVNSKRLRFFDGSNWYALVLENPIAPLILDLEVSDEIEATEEITEATEPETEQETTPASQTCIPATTCGGWGDCINDYQTRTCTIINEDCSESETTEEQECVTENPFQGEIIEEAEEEPAEKKIKEKLTKEEVEAEVEEEITIALEYKTGTIYDDDNDGNESTTGVIDLTVENTVFNWGVDESKLCTRWETLSLEANESITVCYGSEQCCSFMEFTPTRDKWNEIFYSNYAKYGATYNNTISARVVYVDYNLSIDKLFAEVYYSDWANLEVNFYAEAIPEELFDITFDIEENTLSSSDKLAVLITLQNFGRKHVPVRLIYIIEDEAGNEVYKDFEETKIYRTQELIIKTFEELDLDPGNYKFVFKIEYAGIVEEFKDTFTVKKNVFVILKDWFTGLFRQS